MSKSEMYVNVLDFDGRLKPLEYLCEDMTVEDLKEIKEEA